MVKDNDAIEKKRRLLTEGGLTGSIRSAQLDTRFLDELGGDPSGEGAIETDSDTDTQTRESGERFEGVPEGLVADPAGTTDTEDTTEETGERFMDELGGDPAGTSGGGGDGQDSSTGGGSSDGGGNSQTDGLIFWNPPEAPATATVGEEVSMSVDVACEGTGDVNCPSETLEVVVNGDTVARTTVSGVRVAEIKTVTVSFTPQSAGTKDIKFVLDRFQETVSMNVEPSEEDLQGIRSRNFSVTGDKNQATVRWEVENPNSVQISGSLIIEDNNEVVERRGVSIGPGSTKTFDITVHIPVPEGETETHEICANMEDIERS